MKQVGIRIIGGAMSLLLLLSAWGCAKQSKAGTPQSTADGALEAFATLPPDSSSAPLPETTLPTETATKSTTKKATTTRNVNTKGNKITNDPKYVGDVNKRKDEDPQYNKKPSSTPQPSDTISTKPSTTAKPTQSGTTTTAPATTGSVQPPSNGWYTAGGKTYFYNNGKPVTGWQSMNGFRYYFDSKGVLSSKVGLDVSEYQTNIDWNKVKASGVDFVMLRVGFRGWGQAGNIRLDAEFKNHIIGASKAGLDIGVYFYTQAITTAEAKEEARFVLEAIKGFTLTYPIAFDIEDSGVSQGRTNLAKLNNTQRTDITLAFCDTIKQAGYFPSIYANMDWLNNKLQTSRLASQYDIWLAHYTSSLQSSYKGDYGMWQYTSSGSVNGISGRVDCNISLKDYAAITHNPRG